MATAKDIAFSYVFILGFVISNGYADEPSSGAPSETLTPSPSPSADSSLSSGPPPSPSADSSLSSGPPPSQESSNSSLNITTDTLDDETWEYENTTFVDTRRIMFSKDVPIGKRPYMVYLQLTMKSAKAHKYRGWLCGGVIVHPSYVLTSAACVEDADHFYIVSGTNKYVDSFDFKTDDCICKHRRKVVWKCIPKNYKFDFQDSTKWSSNDIAIVKVDRPFKLGVCEKGCQFATDLVCYNNISKELEKPGTKGFIAGWGSGSNFREGVYRDGSSFNKNAPCLQEAKVCVMDNEACAKKWAQKFRSIIQQYMICTKDVMRRLSEICEKKYANCTDIDDVRRYSNIDVELSGQSVNVDLGRHLQDPDHNTARRASLQGGFCENDHGGPLIVKYQGKERVIGVISACKIDPKSHSCYGPFLYTSVFKNRQFISCSINKDIEDSCRRVFRTGITHEEFHVDWDGVNEDEGDETLTADRKEADKNTDDESSSSVEKKKDKTLEKKAKSESKETESEQSKEDVKLEKPKKKKKGKKSKSEKKDGGAQKDYESSKDDNVNEPDSE